jgi:hypothetical protein
VSEKASSQISTPILYGTGLVALALIMLFGLRLADSEDAAPVDASASIDRSYHVLTKQGPNTFALTSEDMDLWMQSTTLFDADRALDNRDPDSFSGGEIFMVFHDQGALQFFTGPTGRVWRIRQRSGKQHACGSNDDGLAAAAEMASRFALVDLSDAQLKSIKRALSEDTFFDANLGIAKLGISGSCVDAITLTAL